MLKVKVFRKSKKDFRNTFFNLYKAGRLTICIEGNKKKAENMIESREDDAGSCQFIEEI